MKKILIATKNEGKFNELRTYLSDLPLDIVSLADLKIKKDIEEDGKTYSENSKKKALFFARLSGFPTLADDSGIEIEALNGEPGVNTRRWLGRKSSDEELMEKVLTVSKTLPENNRFACFKVVTTLAFPNGKFYQGHGKVRGVISKKVNKKLLKGYPFRSIFFISELGKYLYENELSEEEQKLYNHRYKAIAKLRPIIKKELC